MIAFYAWTDTHLINAVRVKTGLYQTEEADLFILNLPRVSEPLVKQIEREHYFGRIIRIDEPRDDLPGKLHKLLKPFRSEYYYKAYTAQLASVKGTVYDRLLTGALWAWSLFLYRFLAESNPDIRIGIVEEGIISYGGARTAGWCDAISRKRDLISRHTLYRKCRNRAIKALDRIYLSSPEMCLDSSWPEPVRIPDDCGIPDELRKEMVSDETIALYAEKKVIVFLQPEPENEMETTLRVLKILLDHFGKDKVLVRIHPESDREPILKKIPAGVTVDTAKEPYEILMRFVDWRGKLLVARASTCLFMPSLVLRQSPAIMLLYDLYKGVDDRFIREMAASYRQKTEHPERVLIPGSFDSIGSLIADNPQAPINLTGGNEP